MKVKRVVLKNNSLILKFNDANIFTRNKTLHDLSTANMARYLCQYYTFNNHILLGIYNIL